jgi:photosystem II stability/assembly factor-like uncharacterized protein
MKNFFFLVLSLGTLTSFVNSQTIQWQQLNGPHGGTAISFASNESGDIFAGSASLQNAVNRSTDGGLTWLMSSNGIQDIGYRSIGAIFVTESNNIIIGTYSGNGDKIYRSTDNGDNWTAVADLGARSFAINDSGHIYAVHSTGFGTVHKSTDNGMTWQQVLSIPNDNKEDIVINDSGYIFIVGSWVRCSTDYGATWIDKVNGLFQSGYVNITSIAVNDSGHLFIGCVGEAYSEYGIFKSTNNGDLWVRVKGGIQVASHHNIVINNLGQIFVGSYGSGIWKSTDNGVSWIQQNIGLEHLYIRSMHISNGVLYAGTEGGGIYRSDDQAESWVQVGFNAAIVKKISISPVNGNLFTAVSGVSRSTDLGQSWEPVNYGLADYETKTFAIKNDGTIFCGTAGNNASPLPTVFRSTNNGDSWVVADTGLTIYSKNAMAVDQQGDIYIGDNAAVYKSTNNGGNWFSIGGPGSAIGLAFNSAGDLFLARGQEIWRKLNGDSVWTQMPTQGFWFNLSLFIGSNDYIYANQYRSTDNGVTWTQMISLERDANTFCENSLGHLFAGHVLGVYRSTDYGVNWTQVNDGLTFTNVLSLGIDSDGFLYAGTNGRSIFKTVNSTTDVKVIKFEPTKIYLEQNYPNPFNPSTRIQYAVSSRQFISLKVYDILGEEIETLVNEEKPEGPHEVEFNASTLPSGVYFYQLKAGTNIETKKMLLMK